jgi:hypothetical protein
VSAVAEQHSQRPNNCEQQAAKVKTCQRSAQECAKQTADYGASDAKPDLYADASRTRPRYHLPGEKRRHGSERNADKNSHDYLQKKDRRSRKTL